LIKEQLKALIKYSLFQLRNLLSKFLLPEAYQSEFIYFENIRSLKFSDLNYLEANLRKITHQLDKTLTFRNFKQMESMADSISKAVSKVKSHPDYDNSTIGWCESVLAEYSKRRNDKELNQGAAEKFSSEDRALLEKIIHSRRSIRSYTKDPIDRGLVEKILRAGLWAPTGCNRQTVEFLVLQSEEDIAFCQPIAGEGYPFPKEAPLAIIVLVDPRNYALPGQRHMAYLEGGASIQNMLLTASVNGLGACWLFWNGNNKRNVKFLNHFNLPQWLLPVAMVCFGYPHARPSITPERKSLKRAAHYGIVTGSNQ